MISYKLLQPSHQKLRLFSTTSANCNFFKKLRSKVVLPSDAKKRPSDLEIKKKNLPENTPTVEQRMARDQVYKFHANDKHGGYHLGPTGTWKDYIGEFLKTRALARSPKKERRSTRAH